MLKQNQSFERHYLSIYPVYSLIFWATRATKYYSAGSGRNKLETMFPISCRMDQDQKLGEEELYYLVWAYN